MPERYDYIVCGAGAAGCVIARRLSDDPSVSVLLIEAGDTDDIEPIRDPARWPENLGSERDWGYAAEPSETLDGRAIPLAMGKVLGGGSSINALQWARGHKQDWDLFAAETGEPAWRHDAVKTLYASIETIGSAGAADHLSADALITLEAAVVEGEEAPTLVRAAASIGMPTYPTANDRMVEGIGGAAALDTITWNGSRRSVYRAYLHTVRDRPNLTIMTRALVTRILFDGRRASGVAVRSNRSEHRFAASREVVVSLGAINTPKLLIQSGIGPGDELRRLGVPVIADLPGVGQNFQDHLLLFGCAWAFERPGPAPNASRAVLQWRSRPELMAPDIQIQQSNGGTLKAEMQARGLAPEHYWSLAPALIEPRSRGAVRVTGPDPDDPVQVVGNYLSEPEDLNALLSGIELCRDLAAAPELRGHVGQEILPGPLSRDELVRFIRQRVGTFWHQSCTAKMGRDAMSVVNGRLQVHGVDALRVADASVLPHVTRGNTMAPCVVIGEMASAFIKGSMPAATRSAPRQG